MADTAKAITASVAAGVLLTRSIGKGISVSASAGVTFTRDIGKNVGESISAGALISRDINKHATTGVNAGVSFLRGVDKYAAAGVAASPLIARGAGKKLLVNTSVAVPTVLHDIEKGLSVSASAGVVIKKGTGKNINANVTLTGVKLIDAVKLTMYYYGNAELGLGAEEGAQFDIIVTGTFSVFSISMNGKTLTYTENCMDQTITIDNVNATVKNGATNNLSKVTGDVTDFLRLIPGDNIIEISKTGDNVDFKFDFRPQFI